MKGKQKSAIWGQGKFIPQSKAPNNHFISNTNFTMSFWVSTNNYTHLGVKITGCLNFPRVFKSLPLDTRYLDIFFSIVY